MKKTLTMTALLLLPALATAEVLPTKDIKTGEPITATQNSQPPKFYLSIKGGSSSLSGTFGGEYTDEIDFDGASSGVFVGAVGFDFGTRVEFEISSVVAGDLEFTDIYKDMFHKQLGYTSYMLNFVFGPKISDTVSLPITLGFGGASLSFTDTDDTDMITMKAEGGFAMNLGIGLDIKLSDHFSIAPEFRLTPIIATASYSACSIFGCVTGTEPLYVTSVQALLGLKITF